MTRIGVVAAVIIIVIASVFFGFRKAARDRADDEKAAAAKASGAASSSSPSPAPRKTAKGTPLEDARPLRRIDPESRKLLVEDIARARATRTSSSPPALPDAPQELSKEYIKTQMEALIPLVTECYTEAQKDDPKLAGKLYVKFAIGGEPDVGGLVESSEIDPAKSTIQHAAMNECVRETMYGLELVAPPEGGRVVVHYTFAFSPSPSPRP